MSAGDDLEKPATMVMLNLDMPQRPESLADVRQRLMAPNRPLSVLPLLGASALLALSAFALASSIILGPFWQTKDPPALAAAEAKALR